VRIAQAVSSSASEDDCSEDCTDPLRRGACLRRHAHASVLLRAGVNPRVVQQRLGHSSVAFTLNVYSHVVPELEAEAAEKAAALVFGR
jgi:integrase